MDHKLVDLDREAMALKNAGKWQEAAQLYESILNIEPNWEHGYGCFNLAECYEGSERFADAQGAYARAVEVNSSDPILLGGLASFLYLHGDPSQAFDCYCQLLQLDERRGDLDSSNISRTALCALGARLEWSEQEISSRISSRLK